MSTICGVVGGSDDSRGHDLRAMGAAAPDPGEPPVLLEGDGFGLAVAGGGRPIQLQAAPGLTIVADAALADRANLARALGLEPGALRELEDAELILHAYLRWGERCAGELNGAYAFALWDPRRELLVLGRDHIGMRPLHWWADDRRCVVASDPDVVLAHPAVERRVDIDAYLALLVRNPRIGLDRSVWQGVGKVPPGQVLLVSPEGVVRQRHVHWAPAARAEMRLAGPADYAEALRETMVTAAADAVRTPGRVGAHVSGGLDSSAVAVLGHRALEREGSGLARLFSWSPSPEETALPDGDERVRVLEVAAQLGVPASFVDLDVATVEAHAARVRAMRPTNTARRELAVVREAAKEGVGVLLSGWGGDELPSFNGRGVLARMARTGRWVSLWRELVALSRRLDDGALAKVLARELSGRVVTPLLPVPLWRALHLAEDPLEKTLQRQAGLTWADVHPHAAALARETPARYQRAIGRGGRSMQLELLSNGHLTARLEAWALLGAEHGVEHRYPLLDRRVMELCLSFPERLWLHDGWRRWLFRAATEPLLPSDVPWSDGKYEPARDSDRAPVPAAVVPHAAEGDPALAAVLAKLRRRSEVPPAPNR